MLLNAPSIFIYDTLLVSSTHKVNDYNTQVFYYLWYIYLSWKAQAGDSPGYYPV